MDFQKTFQAFEQPSQTYLSCYAYTGEADDTVPRHCHSYYELTYISSGSRQGYINDHFYDIQSNALLFIPPLTIHNLNNTSVVKDVVIQFNQKFLRHACVSFESKHMLKSCLAKKHDHFQLQHSDELCKVFETIQEHCIVRDNAVRMNSVTTNDRLYYDLVTHSLCLQMLSIMIKDQLLYLDTEGASYSDMVTMDPLITAIVTNPNTPINMHEASHMVGMSYSHFSRSFEKITGFNYSTFCNILRIRHAEELLLNSSLPISDIATEIGIDTTSYFTRLFRQINGHTPSEYRKRFQS